MIIVGIMGFDGIIQTTNLISNILSVNNKRISIIDINNFKDDNCELLRSYISELAKSKIDILIFKIDLRSLNIEFLYHTNFDIIVYDQSSVDTIISPFYDDKLKSVFNLLNKKGIAIVNADNIELLKVLEGFKQYTVTFGFNPKACVTTSSVGEDLYTDNFLCCLQRTICTKSGEFIEPQEYKISVIHENVDTYNILAAASFAIVNDIDLNSLKITLN